MIGWSDESRAGVRLDTRKSERIVGRQPRVLVERQALHFGGGAQGLNPGASGSGVAIRGASLALQAGVAGAVRRTRLSNLEGQTASEEAEQKQSTKNARTRPLHLHLAITLFRVLREMEVVMVAKSNEVRCVLNWEWLEWKRV